MAFGSPPPSNRGRKTGLSLAQIVSATVAIADGEGIEGVSMRRVADILDHGVMSLYRHVVDKEALIAHAADEVFGEEPFPEPAPEGWHARIMESAHRQWRCYRRHPWIASVVSLARPLPSPNGMREMEWALEGLRELGASSADKARLYLAVAAFVHGAASQAAREVRERDSSGLTAAEWWNSQAAGFRALAASGEYPLIGRMKGPQPGEVDGWFEMGLECLLDGFELRLTKRP